MTVMEEQFLTVKEVAAALHVTPYWVRKLLREEKLKGYRPGGQGLWLVRKSDFQQYLEMQAEYRKPEER